MEKRLLSVRDGSILNAIFQARDLPVDTLMGLLVTASPDAHMIGGFILGQWGLPEELHDTYRGLQVAFNHHKHLPDIDGTKRVSKLQSGKKKDTKKTVIKETQLSMPVSGLDYLKN